MIWAVRDSVEKVDDNGEIITVDAGERDKRMMAVEPELVRILRVAGRAGSILSPVLRVDRHCQR